MSIKTLLGKAKLYYNLGIRGAPLKRYTTMIRYFVLSHILRKDVPWVLELSVTYRCQCRCDHCSASKYMVRKDEEMTTEEICKILDQCAEIGVPKVDFFGGEPMLRKDILELVKHGADLGLYISITTNGWSDTREMVGKLKEAGLACLHVSLDSADAAEHDQLRHLDGVFAKATEAIKYCAEFGIPCIASTYITREWVKNFGAGEKDDSHLTKLLKLCREVNATAVRILFPIISGQWENAKTLDMTDEEKCHIINNIDPSFAFIEGAYSVVRGKKTCQALAGKMFGFTPYGEIQLCVAFPDSFGSIRQKPLRQLLADMHAHPTYCANEGTSCCATKELIRTH